MAQPHVAHAPSLELIFETIHGFQRSSAVKAALELDVFTGIAGGADTAVKLARHIGASEKGTRILCDALTVYGLLAKDDGRYGLTADTALFLTSSSPAYMGSAVEFLLAPPQVEPFANLAAAVREGGAEPKESVVAPDHPVWVKFARAMAPLMAYPAELLAGLLVDGAKERLKVLDIAAGHGLYGIAAGKRNPRAEIVALDWPNVLALAEENARAAGLEGRFRKIEGNAFEVELGTDYDLVLLPNFLHHFDPATIEAFLGKIHASLNDGGRLAILEFIPNDDLVSPRVPAQFSLMMLATTQGGDAYTYAAYQRLLQAAGYRSNKLHDLAPTYFRVVVAEK